MSSIYYYEIVELGKGVIKMSPQIGRPKVENPKRNDIKVRLDDKTTYELDKYCQEKKLTRAEAIRRGIHLLLKK